MRCCGAGTRKSASGNFSGETCFAFSGKLPKRPDNAPVTVTLRGGILLAIRSSMNSGGGEMRSSLIVFGLATILAGTAAAQLATTTALVGTVTDPSGKSVAGAKVTAVENGTHDTYTANTNEQGYYSIEFVRVGTYSVTVEQSGFQMVTKTGIVVDINQLVRTDVEMPVGAL